MENRTLLWQGPCGIPGYEGARSALPAYPGVYLFTYPAASRDGNIVVAAGVTKDIRTRFQAHRRSFLKGEYHIQDMVELAQMRRVDLWRGWGERDSAAFEANRDRFVAAAERQLRACEVFVTGPIDDARLRERIEASLLLALYALPSPHRELLDQGMHRRARRSGEEPIAMDNVASTALMGLPARMVV